MLRNKVIIGLVMLGALVSAQSALAQQQGLAINVGYFGLRGEDGRVDGDVLVANRSFHTFEFEDFNGATISGEWLFALGPFLEGGVGVGYFQRTVPSVYTEYVNESGAEIEQDFKLRVVPITAIARFLPLGRRAAFQPYVGAGVSFNNWRYSETGEFIDENGDIFRGNFVEKGTNAGPVIVGGIRIPAGLSFAVGGEIRWTKGEGEIDRTRFNGDRIDLGGLTYQFTLIARF